MWMLKRVKVALHERALVYRDRNLERVLAPGKYWLGSLTVYGGLEGVLTNLVPGLTKAAAQ